MPVTGRKPKPEGQRRNRSLPAHEWVEVEDIPFADAPKLPHAQPDGWRWPAETRRWWRVISTMPHCALWADGDWQFARETAVVAARFHDGDLRYAKELRDRERIMGTTADARRDLRIRYVEPTEEERAGPTAIEEYRRRLGVG